MHGLIGRSRIRRLPNNHDVEQVKIATKHPIATLQAIVRFQIKSAHRPLKARAPTWFKEGFGSRGIHQPERVKTTAEGEAFFGRLCSSRQNRRPSLLPTGQSADLGPGRMNRTERGYNRPTGVAMPWISARLGFLSSTVCIPSCLENPKIGRAYDAEVVSDRIAEDRPVFRYLLVQEM